MFGNDAIACRYLLPLFGKSQYRSSTGTAGTPDCRNHQRSSEYQPMLVDAEAALHRYLPEMGQTNPFLHLGMHCHQTTG